MHMVPSNCDGLNSRKKIQFTKNGHFSVFSKLQRKKFLKVDFLAASGAKNGVWKRQILESFAKISAKSIGQFSRQGVLWQVLLSQLAAAGDINARLWGPTLARKFLRGEARTTQQATAQLGDWLIGYVQGGQKYPMGRNTQWVYVSQRYVIIL